MADIMVRPTPLSYGIDRDAYDAFEDAMRAEGLSVEIELPYEERGSLRHAASDIGIWLLDNSAQALLDVVVLKMLATFGGAIKRRKHGPSKRVVRSTDPAAKCCVPWACLARRTTTLDTNAARDAAAVIVGSVSSRTDRCTAAMREPLSARK